AFTPYAVIDVVPAIQPVRVPVWIGKLDAIDALIVEILTIEIPRDLDWRHAIVDVRRVAPLGACRRWRNRGAAQQRPSHKSTNRHTPDHRVHGHTPPHP